MKLSHLIKTISVKNINGASAGSFFNASDINISSIHYNSQEVLPGGLFIAIPGFKSDGHDYIDDALNRGAAAVLVQKPVKKDAVVIEVDNTRKVMGIISAQFYGNPSEHIVLIGITGTNGKTTTSFLIEKILVSAGFNTGVIGTIDWHYMGKSFRNPVTTPESLDLQKILSIMKENGVTHVVMEASSHAIDLHRLDGCHFNIGVFTNLTQDHLDYHKDMESYWQSKQRLFTEYIYLQSKKQQKTGVINCNSLKGKELLRNLKMPCITAGYSQENMVNSKNFQFGLDGITGNISLPGGNFNFKSFLTGDYNLENILCAAGTGAALGIEPDLIKAGIESLKSVSGRIEAVFNTKERFVYVDYAHTPDALENVLSTLKALGTGKIICVFGCGGDRDKNKRPQMGRMAASFSDISIVTSDNPRSEDPGTIINHILPGIHEVCLKEYLYPEILSGFDEKGYLIEPDRRKAINLAVKISSPGDIVLIAGKGHETYQIIGTKTLSFDDRKEAQKALEYI
ncbi:UDP-N-acetylmuramoyl-L-alanyl-D-glutamate--2,6-diaminopimelate ligase [Desulfonema limicola]|uniref:UDP-N-acetylmuramoyl-L-alanyl-D-glutamate--2,6-diaminopimelate ligase n=1 Tax=Desulfonema limicola TaxID=45656 RepID=A0A975BBA0_9BACT|nr:UDP-N-acetylmuramoyl-L-alanyl-D-glutamate--2,6-diaminopimelate ligase [Desulfonema limicola]QTA82089.1 UDP-N-acetylmuramoyl-L-alanyl-D-glutamate--2,6-diaminopimelate ligase [Desulfonema limicola]